MAEKWDPMVKWVGVCLGQNILKSFEQENSWFKTDSSMIGNAQ